MLVANYYINKITMFSHQEFNTDYYKNVERILNAIEDCEDLTADAIVAWFDVEENTRLPYEMDLLLDMMNRIKIRLEQQRDGLFGLPFDARGMNS